VKPSKSVPWHNKSELPSLGALSIGNQFISLLAPDNRGLPGQGVFDDKPVFFVSVDKALYDSGAVVSVHG